MKNKKLFLEIAAALFISLWVYAAMSKILDYQLFRVQLSKSPLLTDFAGFVGIAVPVTELIIAVMLVFNRTRLWGVYASLFLMTLFTAYLIAILNFSYYVPCSCGGILGSLGWMEHIIFNTGFIALAIIAIIMIQGRARESGKSKVIFE